MSFAVEVLEVENGYLIFEGNSLADMQFSMRGRRKWVARSTDELSRIIYNLAMSVKVEPAERVKQNQPLETKVGAE